MRFISDYTGFSLIWTNFRTDAQRNAVFVWIPKNAGSSISNALRRNFNAVRMITLDKLRYRFPQKGVVTFGHMSYDLLVKQGYIQDQFHKSAFKFAFSRNPYDRAVSLYFYFRKVKRGNADNIDTFLGFCRHLRDSEIEGIGLFNFKGMSQCNPQVRWLDNVEMDYIGKYETLAADAKTVFTELGNSNIDIGHNNKIDHQDYRSYYCQESESIIRDIYQEDFQYFDYSQDLF